MIPPPIFDGAVICRIRPSAGERNLRMHWRLPTLVHFRFTLSFRNPMPQTFSPHA
jgi:hypothetical protein